MKIVKKLSCFIIFLSLIYLYTLFLLLLSGRATHLVSRPLLSVVSPWHSLPSPLVFDPSGCDTKKSIARQAQRINLQLLPENKQSQKKISWEGYSKGQ